MAASTAKKTLNLFYDVGSPYSWLAFEVLTRYKPKWNINLDFKPMFLGGVMKGSDNSPPPHFSKKMDYVRTDLERLKRYTNVPINYPSNPEVLFRKGATLAAMRLVTAVNLNHPEHVENLSRELWMRLWSRDEDVTKPSSLVQAAKKAGLSEAVITDALLKIREQAIKDKLKDTTDEALEYGAFGAPIIVAHVNGKSEMVWGSDRFPILAEILGEEYKGPLNNLSKVKL